MTTQHRLPFLRIAPQASSIVLPPPPRRPRTTSVGVQGVQDTHNPRFARLRWNDSCWLQCCFVCTSCSQCWESRIDREHLGLKQDGSIYNARDTYWHGEAFNVWTHALASFIMFVYLSVRLFLFETQLQRLPYTEIVHFAAIGVSCATFFVSSFYHSYNVYKVCGAWIRATDFTFVYATICATLVAETAIAAYDSGETSRAERFDPRPMILDAILPTVFTACFFLANRFVTRQEETWLPRGELNSQGDMDRHASRRMYHTTGGILGATRMTTSALLFCGYLLVIGRTVTIDLTPTSRGAQDGSILINGIGILLTVASYTLDSLGFPDNPRAKFSSPTPSPLHIFLRNLPDAHVTWHVMSFLYAMACTLSREWLLCYLRKDQHTLFIAPGESDPFGSWCNRTVAQ